MEKLKQSQIIGLKLRDYRIKNTLSQAELAEQLGLASNTVCKYEKEGINDINLVRYMEQKLGIELLPDNISKIKNMFKENNIKIFNYNELKKELEKLILTEEDVELIELSFLNTLKEYINLDDSTNYGIYSYKELNQIFKELRKIYPLVSHLDEEDKFNNYYNVFVSNLICFIINVYRKLYNSFSKCLHFGIEGIRFSYLTPWYKTLEKKEVEQLITDILSFEMNSYEKATCYFLLKSLLYYLIDNMDLGDNYKNLINVSKLMFAADKREDDTSSPLDKIFAKVEAECPNSAAVTYYKSYKMSNCQRAAVVLCLYGIDTYINNQSGAYNEHIFSSIHNLIKKSESNYLIKTFSLCDLTETNIYQLICYKEDDKINSKSISDKFRKEKISTVKSAVERIVLKRGEVSIDVSINPETGEPEFNYNIE